MGDPKPTPEALAIAAPLCPYYFGASESCHGPNNADCGICCNVALALDTHAERVRSEVVAELAALGCYFCDGAATESAPAVKHPDYSEAWVHLLTTGDTAVCQSGRFWEHEHRRKAARPSSSPPPE